MLSSRMIARTRLSSSALRWLLLRLSLRPVLAWRDIAGSLLLHGRRRGGGRLGRPVLQLHAQRESPLGGDFLDLLEALPAGVLRPEQFRFVLSHQVRVGSD